MIVWLASYPRSGNTFFRTILKSVFGYSTYSIYNDNYDINKNPLLKNVTGHETLASGDLERFRKSDNYYFVKTHNLPTAEQLGDKIIYLVRDGRSSTLSFRNYLQKFSTVASRLTVNDIVNGVHDFGSWHGHVRAWQAIDQRNTIVIPFEKLIEDATEFIREVAKLVGKEAKSDFIHSFEQLNKIDGNFFRKGKTDSWKSELSEVEHKYFWTQAYREMRALGYTDGMPECYNNPEILEVLELVHVNGNRVQVDTIAQRNQEIEQLKKNQADAQKKIAEFVGELDNLTQINNSFKSKSNRINDRMEGLNAEKQALAHSNQNLHQQILTQQNEINRLEQILSTNKTEYSKIKNALDVCARQAKEKETEYSEIKHALDACARQAKATEKEITSIRTTHAETISALRTDNEFYKNHSMALLRILSPLKQILWEYRVLSAKLAEYTGNYTENEHCLALESILIDAPENIE